MQALTYWDSPEQLPDVWSQTDKNNWVHWQSVVSESASAPPGNEQEEEVVEHTELPGDSEEANAKMTIFYWKDHSVLQENLRISWTGSMAKTSVIHDGAQGSSG